LAIGDVILQAIKINKEFPGVKALTDVDFELKSGEVHVLLGENGAGKSTLIKILSGIFKKDSGKILLNSKEDNYHTPLEALKKGISTIYQEFNLVPNMSVAENIFLGKEIMKGALINWEEEYREANKLLKFLDIDIDCKKRVKELGVAEKQMVEIAKALSIDSKIIIFDEPSAVLTEKELTKLFNIINELKTKGVGIIYISHRLEEISIIGDRVTVLRNGQYIGTIPVKKDEVETWISMMVGRSLAERFPKRKCQIKDEILRVENINYKNILKNITFNLHSGEILGISGLIGAGRTELGKAIFGALPIDSGTIYLRGKKIIIKDPATAIKNKICYLPEERKTEGLILKMNVKENITLSALDLQCIEKGIINLKKEKNIAESFVDIVKIKTPSIQQNISNLSGGNQQKVVVAKWLCAQSDIFIFDEPTRGIDIGAKVEIYKFMNELVSKGAAIIMISSELPEILGMSDRVIVMRLGEIKGEFDINEATEEKILAKAWGR
jgi:ribose transport system ATP-binding protein